LEADGAAQEKYSKAVKDVELKSEDAALSADEKIERAKELVQGGKYIDYKDEIYENISLYTQDLLDGTRKRERENSALFSKYQQIQMILIVALICILMVTVAFTTIFLIRPLRKSSKLITEQNSLPVKGTTEMRTFAMLYNKALEKTKTQQDKLTYAASHDSLTGIQNRIVFDEMYRSVQKTDDITLVLIDVDAFKEINDTKGHDIGDSVLKKVASVLHTSFRSGDVICRIGGDEFALILNGLSSEQKEQLENKLRFVMHKLGEADSDAPAFTLSMGVAFGSEKDNFKILYKKADQALYGIKTTSKNGIGFYEE
ncbi:MAG: GGDEF domain-containing protein, partial [Clostridia bacterium]|nr:GGDEF domain-containing protein [Clostridia bacterium]